MAVGTENLVSMEDLGSSAGRAGHGSCGVRIVGVDGASGVKASATR